MTYTYRTIILGPQQAAGLDQQLNELGRAGYHLVALSQNTVGGVIAVMEKAVPPAAG